MKNKYVEDLQNYFKVWIRWEFNFLLHLSYDLIKDGETFNIINISWFVIKLYH